MELQRGPTGGPRAQSRPKTPTRINTAINSANKKDTLVQYSTSNAFILNIRKYFRYEVLVFSTFVLAREIFGRIVRFARGQGSAGGSMDNGGKSAGLGRIKLAD
jgi:hypothetical protein